MQDGYGNPLPGKVELLKEVAVDLVPAPPPEEADGGAHATSSSQQAAIPDLLVAMQLPDQPSGSATCSLDCSLQVAHLCLVRVPHKLG